MTEEYAMKILEKWTIACVALATAMCGGVARAATETVDGIEWTYTLEDGEAEIQAVQDSVSGQVAIPGTLGGAPVTAIAASVFSGLEEITGITIPDSVNRIGNDAFCGCSGLTELALGPNITSFGENAFIWCEGLRVLYVPASWEDTPMLDNAGIPDGCEVIYCALPSHRNPKGLAVSPV